MRSTMALIGLGASALLALTGCAAAEPAPAAPAPSATAAPEAPTPSPSAQPASERGSFTMPTSCTDMLPESRLEWLADEGFELLAGPGGLYGDTFYADQTAQQQLGGLTCIWGSEPQGDLPLLDISVAPISPDTRAGVIDRLVSQGLNETVVDDVAVYGRFGDMNGAAATINELRVDSWIGVISSYGGEDYYETVASIATEIADEVYSAG